MNHRVLHNPGLISHLLNAPNICLLGSSAQGDRGTLEASILVGKKQAEIGHVLIMVLKLQVCTVSQTLQGTPGEGSHLASHQ